MSDPPIAIIGAGRFARSVLRGITTALKGRVRAVLISRSPESLREAVASLRDDGVALETELIDPTSDSALRDWLAREQPPIVVNCASTYTPGTTSSPAGQLAAQGWFGATYPLQIQVASAVSAAISRANIPCTLINASYPDAVNQYLWRANSSRVIGVGNGGSLMAWLVKTRGITPESFLLFGHVHLHHLPSAAPAPKLWTPGGRPIPIEAILADWYQMSPAERNEWGGVHAGMLTAALLGAETPVQLIAPDGALGTSPGTIRAGKWALRELPTMDAQEVARWNRGCLEAEGLTETSSGLDFAMGLRHSARALGLPPLPPLDGPEAISEAQDLLGHRLPENHDQGLDHGS